MRRRSNAEGKAGHFLLIKDERTGKLGYLSSLYRKRTEFEDRGSALRYRIDKEPDARYVRIVCIGPPTRRLGVGA